MSAKTQYKMEAADLALVLALVRTGKLALAGERLGVDASTVFRSLQRIERGLATTLFARSRHGYAPNALAEALAEQGERLETLLEEARSVVSVQPEHLAGSVRITTTDTVLHALVAPALAALRASHPQLDFEIATGNELANLTRRDADIALRATRKPPAHLVGKKLGVIRVALYAARRSKWTLDDALAGKPAWIAPDDALPEHPSVLWRRRHAPALRPGYRVSSIQSVAELVGQGLGVGILPLFLAEGRPDLRALSAELEDAQTELWILTHPEARHVRRVAAVYGHLAQQVRLD